MHKHKQKNRDPKLPVALVAASSFAFFSYQQSGKNCIQKSPIDAVQKERSPGQSLISTDVSAFLRTRPILPWTHCPAWCRQWSRMVKVSKG